MNIVYAAQFRDSSGYAVAARGYLKALDAYLLEHPNAFNLKISKRQRFKTIGNGFTADVISWILSPLLQDQPKTNNERTKQMELF